MKRIVCKLSSKNQITVPKTIRDMLEIGENESIDFLIDEKNNITIEKGKHTITCPFCEGTDFYGQPCLFCNDQKLIDELNESELILKWYEVAGKFNTPIFMDNSKGFMSIEITSMENIVLLYREHFQIEFIKKFLENLTIKELTDAELREKLIDSLKFERSKILFKEWIKNIIKKM